MADYYFFREHFQNGVVVEYENHIQTLQFGNGIKQRYKTVAKPLRKLTFTKSYNEKDYKRVFAILQNLALSCDTFYCYDPVDTSLSIKVKCLTMPKVTRETSLVYTISADFEEVIY